MARSASSMRTLRAPLAVEVGDHRRLVAEVVQPPAHQGQRRLAGLAQVAGEPEEEGLRPGPPQAQGVGEDLLLPARLDQLGGEDALGDEDREPVEGQVRGSGAPVARDVVHGQVRLPGAAQLHQGRQRPGAVPGQWAVPVHDAVATREPGVVAVVVEVVEGDHRHPQAPGQARLARAGGPGEQHHPRGGAPGARRQVEQALLGGAGERLRRRVVGPVRTVSALRHATSSSGRAPRRAGPDKDRQPLRPPAGTLAAGSAMEAPRVAWCRSGRSCGGQGGSRGCTPRAPRSRSRVRRAPAPKEPNGGLLSSHPRRQTMRRSRGTVAALAAALAVVLSLSSCTQRNTGGGGGGTSAAGTRRGRRRRSASPSCPSCRASRTSRR